MLGYAHPDHLLEDLTSQQITEWEAYDRLDPIGSWRDDFRFAKLMAYLDNVVSALYGKKGSTKKPSVPLDFMPNWDLNDEAKAPEIEKESLISSLMTWAKIHNKKVDKQKEQEGRISKPPKRLQR